MRDFGSLLGGVPRLPSLLLAVLWTAGCTPPPTLQEAAQEPVALELIEHDAVLVRGWIGNAAADLEPVIPTAAPPSLADAGAGPYRLRGMGDGGEVLFELRFGDEALASIVGRPGHHFMLVAPVGAGGSLALAAIELDAAYGRAATRHARWSGDTLLDGLRGVRLAARDGNTINVQWDAGRFELLQLRDPASGAILALDRDGEVTAATADGEIEAALSDGVRSAATLLRIR